MMLNSLTQKSGSPLVKLLTTTSVVLSLSIPASADPGSYHSPYHLADKVRQAAKNQRIAEDEQLDLENQQIQKEFEQDQAEWQQNDWEIRRAELLNDIHLVSDALQYAESIGDQALIAERRADLDANIKALNEANDEIEKFQNLASAKRNEARQFRSQAEEKLQQAQQELEIIKRAEYERLKGTQNALDNGSQRNLLDSYAQILKKRQITSDLRRSAEENANRYRSNNELEKSKTWTEIKDQHTEELKTLDVQINFYNSFFGLITVLLGFATFCLQKQLKGGSVLSNQLMEWIQQTAESVLREDLFHDFQESMNQQEENQSLLTTIRQLIRLFAFLRAECQIRREDVKNPNNLKGVGGKVLPPDSDKSND